MQTLNQAACRILLAEKPEEKTKFAHEMAMLWQEGRLEIGQANNGLPPRHPGRPSTPQLISPKDIKRRKLGSVEGRSALLHAVAHIEFYAINLAADMLARFHDDPRVSSKHKHSFITDWVGVCDDEARHFTLIQTRLLELGSHYGAYPAHNGLWEAAISTMDDLAARLVIVPMVLEARGLDVTPSMIKNLEHVQDQKSADILKIIYNEEVGHVAAGTHWFMHICKQESRDPENYFKSLLDEHFTGKLKPPFNVLARGKAGMPTSFYQ